MADVSATKPTGDKKQIPVEEGLFYQPQFPKEKPYLIGARCKLCGYTCFPRLLVCPKCLKRDSMETFHMSGKARLDTFSTCNSALPGFPAPTLQGYVLIEGARIWTLITGTDLTGAELKPGIEMELVIEKLREDSGGNEIMSYKFRPVKTGPGGNK
jgi:uncharacterized OB-fold protein